MCALERERGCVWANVRLSPAFPPALTRLSRLPRRERQRREEETLEREREQASERKRERERELEREREQASEREWERESRERARAREEQWSEERGQRPSRSPPTKTTRSNGGRRAGAAGTRWGGDEEEDVLREMLDLAKMREKALVLQVARLQAEREGLVASRRELGQTHKENTFRPHELNGACPAAADRGSGRAQREQERDAFCRQRLQLENEKLRRQLGEARRQVRGGGGGGGEGGGEEDEDDDEEEEEEDKQQQQQQQQQRVRPASVHPRLDAISRLCARHEYRSALLIPDPIASEK